MANILDKVFGSYSKRELKRVYPLVDKIEELEEEYKSLTDEQLKAKTPEFRRRLEEGETLDDIMPEAFATVREAAWRVSGERAFRVQLIGGIVLHQGRIAEMKTGEGKTLCSTLPAYLNALAGKGLHVVTVNDYLAKYQSEIMGKVYSFLGLTVGLIIHDVSNEDRRAAYNCDITYGTNNEYGFDYLRDNMVIYKEEMVQRHLSYAIVDEVDSILVDEARTPLIISGQGEKSTELYNTVDSFAKRLRVKVVAQLDDKLENDDGDEDYIVDEKASSVALTTKGLKKAEAHFRIENLSDMENIGLMHHINQAIRANGLMRVDKDYVVKDGEIIIVDEFTGRLMYGRRYSDGLHQAIEAKEGVKVERESKTLATITFQNYFRMYDKLAGMTGTAQTEEVEFQTIYKLDVIVIPTNKPMIRIDYNDSVYKTEIGKYKAVIADVEECYKKGQPTLIGTISIEKSELLSSLLKKKGIPHHVLNAKHHLKEAEIIAQAGKYKMVTIATNMAGRGTDIKLGGNPEYIARQEMRKLGYEEDAIIAATAIFHTDDEQILEARNKFNELVNHFGKETKIEWAKVVELGGLYIIGTERHESRRIDNQLRGRSGRQGDPGASRFYISLEDELMRLFGTDRLTGIVEALGLEEDQPIEHRMLSGVIENAQKKVESNNFGIRKHVIQYDDVMNQQREVVYGQRRRVLDGEDLKDHYAKMIDAMIANILNIYCSENSNTDYWDWEGIRRHFEGFLVAEGSLDFNAEDRENMTRDNLVDIITEEAFETYEKKEKEFGSEQMRDLERVVLLRCVDSRWMDHIDAMEQLKHGIGLRAYGQNDPVVEYRLEGFSMFEEMINGMQEDSLRLILNLRIEKGEVIRREKVAEPTSEGLEGMDTEKKPVKNSGKVGRNDPCPCGSGKKYKKCHGVL
jgi:preprotein translocase subunit SecA